MDKDSYKSFEDKRNETASPERRLGPAEHSSEIRFSPRTTEDQLVTHSCISVLEELLTYCVFDSHKNIL